MALGNVLSLGQFWDKLRLSGVQFYDTEPQSMDRTAGGTVLKASIGESYWGGSATLAPSAIKDASVYEIEALLSVVNRAGMSFLAYDPRRAYPAADPDGSILGASTVTVASINANNRELSLEGLPAGYVLTAGDMISVEASSTNHALFRIVTGATADGSGDTSLIEVTPFIPPFVTVGDTVHLAQPRGRFVLVDQSNYGRGRPAIVPGAEFSFVQTFR